MNQLNRDRRILILYLLGNGESIRSVERITGTHRNTIMRLRETTMQKQDAPKRGYGRPPLGDKARDNIVQVRVSETEYESYVRRAEARGYKTVSAWLRAMALKRAREILGEEANP